MLTSVIWIAAAAFGLALLLNLYRLIAGPTVPDRIIALDTAYINSIALLVLYGIHEETTLYFEVALLIAVFGFVSTAMLAKYLLRGDIIE
ncbi:K+/H+ antiporter subunit F [Noviherbaspirillum aerium]|uniref:K+/H+ antiporter subunit F n=1 Tax=Noviherbaspirillum aerium TaxID=2588497 RepID=UPI00124C2CBA|nr:K+/H+ antiporter subunit F [Noviherbaspirillum aerium]